MPKWRQREGVEKLTDPEQLCDEAVTLYNDGNAADAIRLWEQAADIGSPRALYNLGHMAELAGDIAEAKRLYSLACVAIPPFPLAFHNLSVLAMADEDLDTAAELAEAAAHYGVVHGAFNRAQIALWADDLDTAEHWWQCAVELGDGRAAYNLGITAKQNDDPVAAQEWFRIAAELGDADGMNDYAVGLRIAGRDSQAQEWYQRAAAGGSTNAMRNLADIALVDDDVAQARFWLEQAVLAGDEEARDQLAVLPRPAEPNPSVDTRSASSARVIFEKAGARDTEPNEQNALAAYCTNCGCEMGGDDRFCGQCGTQRAML